LRAGLELASGNLRAQSLDQHLGQAARRPKRRRTNPLPGTRRKP
jgi:hypothetical protein